LAQKGPVAFWKYHDMLFEAQSEQDGLERVNLMKMAEELGCNMARFQAALDNHTHQAKVQEDSEAASKLGINGTPAFLINDFYVSGAQPLSVFRRTVKRALSERKKP
jgi:predicted DsbA family dithiol-disulfide isomerase